ncbi:MAG: SDR family oxidoreductase [Ignavibacteria bacterium]|nr:SDR family oxidoreductase [Ignavibacteria bacterium]
MKTALITGASFGIGYELSKIFANEKYNLVLVARNRERLNEIESELKRENNIRIKTLVKDLSNPEAPKEIFDELVYDKIEIDVLVNNAGFGLLGPFAELDLKDQLDMIQVNITSLVHLTGLILPSMIKRGSGKILNVASTAAFQPGPNMAVYYATKAFVLSFSKALYKELKDKGITVTALCPGPTKTEFQKRARMENINLERSKLIPYMSAERVARVGYKGLMKGKKVVIPGFMNKVGTKIVRFAPESFILSILHKFNSKD